MDDLLTGVNSDSLKIFLLGDEEHVLSKAAELMHIKHPGLQLVGTHHGFFKRSGPENDAVVRKINELSPDILLVGMSMPIQEFWIEENFNRLNARTFVPVGAAFRWYCGIEKRPPKWVTDNGFEWLARLVQHPAKLFGRYVIGNPLLIFRVLSVYWLRFGLPSRCSKPLFPGCRNRCAFRGRKSPSQMCSLDF
jgi:N-acetylglucosaminyldiphosphoundecaprenol N-acetyl-beta-D-mannosaminyltransferase